MRKRLVIGVAAPVIAALGLWMGMAGGATAHASKASTAKAPDITVLADHAPSVNAPLQATGANEDPTAADTDNVQSGDQTGPDPSNESASESETEAGSAAETDNVDCQQDGQFDGVNAAGTGAGCDGTGA